MQTVNFQCGHCGKLMGVTENLLGQQVRCPHCQQVVIAPPSAAPQPPPPPPPPPVGLEETTFAAPLPPAEQESIFTPPEEGDEDLFGAGSRPRVEIPPPPAWEPPPAPPPVPPLVDQPPPPPPVPPTLGLPPVEATVTYLPRDESTTPDARLAGSGVGADGASLPPTELIPPAPAPVPDQGPAAGPPSSEIVAPPPTVRAAPRGGGWLLPVLAIYSVVATLCMVAMVAVAMMAHQQQDDMLERLPDDGDHPGASHSQQKPGPKMINFKTIPLHALPDRLRVPLGKSITIGDLKLTPQRVELRRIKVQVGSYNPDESTDDSLVLWLDMENVSRDVVFRPMDAGFNRKWQGSYESGMPFTFVEMGSQKYYGGPCDWPTKERIKVVGQNYDQVLLPGEKMQTFVCTNPLDHVGAALAGYRGPVVYRVRFRRGLVPLLHGGETSATAVVGVVFTPQEVTHADTAS
jgi:hypothetical protein